MAKMFYSAAEAAKKLGRAEGDLKELVRTGKLREFRDAGAVNYKVQDVDSLVGKLGAAEPAKAAPAAESRASASASGEIVLESVEDSGVELAPSGSDVLRLEDEDSEETGVAMTPAKKAKDAKEGTAVASVGINVFDDDELDEVVDPLAQTAVTDVAGLGIEGVGSGSGILDLTRESDDTSLGAELLEEIYTGEEASTASADMGEDTRAGLDEAITQPEESAEVEAVGASGPATKKRSVTRVVEFAPDAFSTGLTAALIVAVVVMWIAGLAGASLVRGIMPSLLSPVYSNLAMYTGGAVFVAGAAAAVAFFVARRSS